MDSCAGEEHPATGVDPPQELRPRRVGLLCRPAQPERHHGELRLVEHLEPGLLCQPLVGEPRQRELLLKLLAEGLDPVELEREPEPKAPEVAGELG